MKFSWWNVQRYIPRIKIFIFHNETTCILLDDICDIFINIYRTRIIIEVEKFFGLAKNYIDYICINE